MKDATDSTAGKLDSISARLGKVQGAVKSLACSVDDEARQSEAWTIHDALRAVRSDVDALRGEEAE